MNGQIGRVLRVNNVAKMCGVSERTVRIWASSRLLTGHKRGQKLWFFYEADVERFMRANLSTPLVTIALTHFAADRYRHIACLLGWTFLKSRLGAERLRPDDAAVLAIVSLNTEQVSGSPADAYEVCLLGLTNLVLNHAELPIAPSSVIDFTIERASAALTGVVRGYHRLWNSHGFVRCEIGDLRIAAPDDEVAWQPGELKPVLTSHWEMAQDELYDGTFRGSRLYGQHLDLAACVRGAKEDIRLGDIASTLLDPRRSRLIAAPD